MFQPTFSTKIELFAPETAQMVSFDQQREEQSCWSKDVPTRWLIVLADASTKFPSKIAQVDFASIFGLQILGMCFEFIDHFSKMLKIQYHMLIC